MPTVSGVIDQFLHPPLGTLNQHVVTTGPFSGLNTFTAWNARAVGDTFGAVFVCSILPPELGYTPGWSGPTGFENGDTYRDRLFQVVVEHQFLSGAWVQTQVVNSFQPAALVLWEVALPGKIGLYCLPGVSVDIYYLLVG